MTSRPMHAHKKNLEQIGRERVSGPWLITPYWDLVSERKFLFFKLKSKACSMLHPSVPAFRVETATALSPSTCPQVMSLSKENDCIEFFTPFCNWMDTSKLDDGCIIDLVQILIRTIARFEKYRFTAFGLARSAIAKTEKGKTALLPIAYILPFELSEAGPNEIAGHEGEKNSEPAYGECHLLDGWVNQSAHLSQLKNIMEELAARSTRKPSARSGRRREDGCEKPGRSFSYRLLEASRRITSGKISSLDELHWALFDQPLERGLRPFRPGRADQDFSRKINEKVDSITRLASSGGVIVLKGEPFSGKSAILGKIAERLRKSRPGNTSILDEWDLFSSNRRKANQAGSNGREVILLIDDMEEKAFAYSKLAMDLLREDELPFKALIMTMDPKHAPDEAKCLLK